MNLEVTSTDIAADLLSEHGFENEAQLLRDFHKPEEREGYGWHGKNWREHAMKRLGWVQRDLDDLCEKAEDQDHPVMCEVRRINKYFRETVRMLRNET